MKLSIDRPWRGSRAIAVLLLFLGFAAKVELFAEGGGLEIDVGFDGALIPDRWNPLYIKGDFAAESAFVEVLREDSMGWTWSIESYPYRRGIRLECPILVDSGLTGLVVRLRAEGLIAAERSIAVADRVFPGHLVICMSLGQEELRSISASLMPAEPVKALASTMAELPAHGLDYDGVSGLVFGQGDLSLSPAQTEAILSWLSGGGRLLVFGANGKSRLREALSRKGALEQGTVLGSEAFSLIEASGAKGDFSRFVFGLGEAAFFSEALDAPMAALADGRWKKLLDLNNYNAYKRLSPAFVFGRRGEGAAPPFADRFSYFYIPAICAGIFAIALAWIASLGGRRLLYAAAAALVGLCVALPGGIALARERRGGVFSDARALMLPGGAGLLLRVQVASPRYDVSPEAAARILRRNLRFSFGPYAGGSVGIEPLAPLKWKHASIVPAIVPEQSSAGGFALEGSLPATAFAEGSVASRIAASAGSPGLRGWIAPRAGADPGFVPPSGVDKIAYLRSGGDGDWLIWDSRRKAWAADRYRPSWLTHEAAWALGLRGRFPALSFLVVAERLESFPLEIGGSPNRELVWILPIPNTEAD